MADWKPEEFAVGDRVVNPSHADWGVGVVVSESRLGELTIGVLVWTYHPKTVGQRLGVRWADGRTRTIISPETPLKRA